MRICHITPEYPPRVGGVGDYVRCLSREFAARGHDVTVVTSAGLGEAAGSGGAPSPRVLPVIKAWNLRGLRKLLKTLGAVNADVYVLEYVAYMYGRGGVAPWLLAFFLKFKLDGRKPLVLNAHELWRPPYRSARDKMLTLISWAVFLGGVWASARVVVTNDFRETLMTRVLGVNSGRVKRIPVGANVEPAAPYPYPAADNGEFRVMTFGRWHEDRSVEDVVEAVADLRSSRRVGLSVIGSYNHGDRQGARARRLRERAERAEWLEITGDLSSEQVSDHFAKADVFVSPLAGGPSGRRGSVVAALAHGLPVVAYDGHERDDIFRSGDNVVLVKAGDRAGLRAVLQALAEDGSLRLDLGVRARATFEDHFAWDVIAGKWEELFAELAPREGP
ncbi:MAG: glycosyltransferase family 4 protein [bacterium]